MRMHECNARHLHVKGREGKKSLYVLLDSAEYDQQDVDLSENGLCRLLAASGRRRSSKSVCRQQDDSICWRKAF